MSSGEIWCVIMPGGHNTTLHCSVGGGDSESKTNQHTTIHNESRRDWMNEMTEPVRLTLTGGRFFLRPRIDNNTKPRCTEYDLIYGPIVVLALVME